MTETRTDRAGRQTRTWLIIAVVLLIILIVTAGIAVSRSYGWGNGGGKAPIGNSDGSLATAAFYYNQTVVADMDAAVATSTEVAFQATQGFLDAKATYQAGSPSTATPAPGVTPMATSGVAPTASSSYPSLTPSGLYEDGCVIAGMSPCDPSHGDWAIYALGSEVEVQDQYANTPLKDTGMNDGAIISIHIACPVRDTACHNFWASMGAQDVTWWGIDLTYVASLHGDIAPQYGYTIVYYHGDPDLGDTASRLADARASRSYIEKVWVDWRIKYNP